MHLFNIHHSGQMGIGEQATLTKAIVADDLVSNDCIEGDLVKDAGVVVSLDEVHEHD